MIVLLAVDLGLACGVAAFDARGRLVWVRSRRFPDRTRHKLGVAALVREAGPGLRHVVGEGDPRLGKVWAREAARVGADFTLVAADDWRRDVIRPSERRAKGAAKAAAGRVARGILARSPCRPPRNLGHDVAEAICLGAWAAGRWGLDVGGEE